MISGGFMKNYTYDNFNQDVAKYIELNLLPHLLAFSFAMLYSHHMLEEESFDRYYNSIRSLVNVIGENKALVQTIMKQILIDKYRLKCVSISPLKFKKI